MIGYIRIPHFAAAITRRNMPELTDCPLILVEERAGRASVYAGCDQTRACGISPGMSLGRAQRLCPSASAVLASEGTYLRAFEACLDTLSLFSPTIEPGGLGCAYLALNDRIRRPDDSTDLFRQLARQLYRDQRVMPAMGVTETMFGSTVAGTRVQPGYVYAAPPGVERGFLAEFPSNVLPVSEEMIRRLVLLGLRQVGQYAALPSGVVLPQFGYEGKWAHRLAQGRDDRQVQPDKPRLIQTQRYCFSDPIENRQTLIAVCDRLVTKLVNRIKRICLAPQTLHVRLNSDDSQNREQQVTFPAPRASETELQRAVHRLIDQTPVRSPISEVEVSFSKLQPLVGRQLTLLPDQSEHEQQAQITLAYLMHRYGQDSFHQPLVTDARSLLLEKRFVLSQWTPFCSGQA